ncbi:hypothetical protein P7C70_g4021, partial [Phenoliferia sp. Uapishka_3]
MGGLVIADTLRSLLSTSTPTSPTILGLIAYDTPYWGLNPSVFKNTADRYIGYAQTGHALLTTMGVGAGLFGAAFGGAKAEEKDTPAQPTTSPPSGYSTPKKTTTTTVAKKEEPAANAGGSWFRVAGTAALLAAGAAGAAYYGKDAVSYSTTALTGHWSWAKSHLSFVAELWNTEQLEQRLEAIEKATHEGVGFHCFYTLLPKTLAYPSTSRTFIVLPRSGKISALFSPNTNSRAADEIGAHVEMFTSDSDGMYALGSETCELIGGWIDGVGLGGEKDGSGKGKEKEGVRLV